MTGFMTGSQSNGANDARPPNETHECGAPRRGVRVVSTQYGQSNQVKGFSRFEFFIVLIVASITGYVFFDRALFYQEMAEKIAAETVVLNIRTSLRYRIADQLIHHKEQEMAGLIGANPMTILDIRPPNYVGEFGQPRWDIIPPGSWYFDTGKKELVYRPKSFSHFATTPGVLPGLRFHISTSDTVRHTDSRSPIIEGVSLILIEQYMWF
jgi:hypothetical protein